MINEKMININVALEIVDLKMGYGVDDYSSYVYKTLDKDDNRRNLLDSRSLRRYMYDYNRRIFKNIYKREPKDYEVMDSFEKTKQYMGSNFIKSEGTTKDRKYNKKDVLYMLENDEKTKKLLRNRFEEKTTILIDEVVPKYSYEYFCAEQSGIIEENEQQEYYKTIIGDSLEQLNMKLLITEEAIKNKKHFNSLITYDEYKEVKGSASPDSSYYDTINCCFEDIVKFIEIRNKK